MIPEEWEEAVPSSWPCKSHSPAEAPTQPLLWISVPDGAEIRQEAGSRGACVCVCTRACHETQLSSYKVYSHLNFTEMKKLRVKLVK